MCHDSALVERPSCSSTRNHSVWLQPWPPCSTACSPPPRRAVDRRVADRGDPLGGQAPARALGLDLERHQHLLDEGARAGLQLGLLGGQGGRGGDDLGGHGSVGLGLRASARTRHHRDASGCSTPRCGSSRARGSTTCASRASPPRRASPPGSCTTTSPRATPCSRRRSSTPTSAPATCASPPSRTGRATAAQRLAAMIDQCLPTDRALHDDFVLWVELWLRSARDPALRPVAARLYARLHAWFAQAMADGVASGELRDCDVDADGRPPAGAHRRLRHPRAHRRPARCRSSAPAPRSGRRSRATSACPRRRALIAAALRARCRSAGAARRPRRRRPPSPRR